MAVSNTISFYVGEDILLDGSIIDSSAAAVDITGWSMTFTVFAASSSTSQTTYLTKTVGSGITITDATNGLFTVSFAAADTSSLSAATYHLLLVRTDTGFATVLAVGFLGLLNRVQ